MRFFLVFWLALTLSTSAFAQDLNVLKIYHDSDWANNTESSEAIWRGMDVALSEVDYTVNGVRIELVKKNHSGNVTRSLRNMKAFLSDEQAIAVFSGLHSPPLITNRAFINENKIPVLVPWAAGGSITRYPSDSNYVFRLSVDDTKAGEALVDHAVSYRKCKNPYLLIESTPWGDSNVVNIRRALAKRGILSVGIKRFGWSMKSHVAKSIVDDALHEGAGCLIIVSGAAEGAKIAISMSEVTAYEHIPLISHWGITGSNFHEVVDKDIRESLDLSFIQTCFSFMDEPIKHLTKDVFAKLQNLYPDQIRSTKDIKAPAGFIHAYDLTKIFIAALNTVQLSDDVRVNRELLKQALETLDTPITGLIKTYKTPFTPFSETNQDAHEALGREDICMGSYGLDNEIILLESARR